MERKVENYRLKNFLTHQYKNKKSDCMILHLFLNKKKYYPNLKHKWIIEAN